MNVKELVYYVPKEQHDKEVLKRLLDQHHEIRFVSFVGVDLRGYGTDEKIPIDLFKKEMDTFLKAGIQTDGSSVVLHNIATLNNAKVDIVPDMDVTWFVDYNAEYMDEETNLPVGTLKIPSFLVHENKRIGSRAILQRAITFFKNQLMEMLTKYPEVIQQVGILKVEDIDELLLTSATELELWVKTPEDRADEEKLSTSQSLKEQYWKKTRGLVRTCLEKTIILMEKYGFGPEMGHKEVGGVRGKLGPSGQFAHIMEQLEIDWKYSDAMQAADNELMVRDLVTDVFHLHGLEVTFNAKPIEGVAGSGEHTHIGVAAKLKDGRIVNLFSPSDMTKDYLSTIGYGALMGILNNYEVVNPFVTSTNDALNRLKPGFEAPVCIVSCLGHSKEVPSRNRSVLVGLVKDLDNPLATRFELRAPNPISNTYLVLASCYQAMLDGMKYALHNNKSTKELEIEFSKDFDEFYGYFAKERVYRSEEDVFEHYTEVERNKLFGIPPKTVWENVKGFTNYPDKLAVLLEGNVFDHKTIMSFKDSVVDKWLKELTDRIIIDNMDIIRACKKLHDNENYLDIDTVRWGKIELLKYYLMKDRTETKSLFTKIREAIQNCQYDIVSDYHIEMNAKVKELKDLYQLYRRNIIEL